MTFPLEILAEICARTAVVCKGATVLPDIGRAERWNEPDEPRHPLVGIIHAIERAGEPVLVCAADMPHVTAHACRELIAASRRGARDGVFVATVAAADGALEPLLGIYTPQALAVLRSAPADAPLRATIEGLEPRRVPLSPHLLHSVNTREDLDAAAGRLEFGAATGRFDTRPAGR